MGYARGELQGHFWAVLNRFGLQHSTVRWLLAASVILLCASAECRAQGIFLPGIGPVNQGMGGAAVAAPLDSAGALAWNPATMSGLCHSEMEIGLGLVLPTNTLSSSAFGLSGSTDGEPGVTPIPAMSFVLKDDCSAWTWGVGVFGIGGFSTNFPSSSLLSPATANPILTPQPPLGIGVGRVYSHAEIYQVTPAASVALSDKLSVGFGANLDVADVQADPLLFAAPNVVLGIPTYGSGTGTRFAWGGGFEVGAYYITDYSWRLGASYKSKQWFEPLRFNSNDILGNPVLDKVRFDLPSITSIGAAYDGWNRIVYAIDVRWYDYSDTAGFGPSGYRADGSVRGLGWRDIFSINNGIQYCVNDCLKLRLGYQYFENPVPSSQEQFNLGTPLIMNHFLSVGASYTIRDGILTHISYTHGFRNSVTGQYVTPLGPIPGTSITSTTSADEIIAGLTVLF